jgi:autotransporter-associated beta strand protein
LSLTGTNTYTGATAINGGTLKVGSGASISASSGVTINGSGATLAGAGTVSGITLTSGTIAPGDSGIGTLTASSLDWTGTSGNNLVFDLSGVGNTSDSLSMSGAFTKGTGSTFAFDFSGGLVGQTYTLASFGSSTFSTGDFSIATAGYTGTFNLDTITTNTLTFTLTAVPEPNEVALAIVGLLGVLVFIRRRNQQV